MSDSDQRIFQQLVGQYGGPAFARRGREVEAAWGAVVEMCRQKREGWLRFVRLPLRMLFAQAGTAAVLASFLDDPEQMTILEKMRDELVPELRVPVAATSSARQIRRTLAELREAIGHFNQRRPDFVAKVDLRHVNDARERYNRYYLLEKECLMGSSRLARLGFQALKPAEPADILRLMPVLEVV